MSLAPEHHEVYSDDFSGPLQPRTPCSSLTNAYSDSDILQERASSNNGAVLNISDMEKLKEMGRAEVGLVGC